MRIIGGVCGGVPLSEIKGRDIRPTTDKVKESMFNILQFQVPGARVLDLFGGTGQLGLEAASRGAREVVIVEKAAKHRQVIAKNIAKTNLPATLLSDDALQYLTYCAPFDLIFIDPPYQSDLAIQALETIQAFDKLLSGGIIVCESNLEIQLPTLQPPYGRLREYIYGKIRLTTYGRT